jgi:formate dehydrogenase subunit delta
MTTGRVAYMANQIAANFAAQGRDTAVADIADHLQKFWEPRMRRALLALVASGGHGLDDLVIAAAARLEQSPG